MHSRPTDFRPRAFSASFGCNNRDAQGSITGPNLETSCFLLFFRTSLSTTRWPPFLVPNIAWRHCSRQHEAPRFAAQARRTLSLRNERRFLGSHWLKSVISFQFFSVFTQQLVSWFPSAQSNKKLIADYCLLSTCPSASLLCRLKQPRAWTPLLGH